MVHLDVDAVKADVSLIDIPADIRLEGSSELALRRLLELVPATSANGKTDRVAARREWVREQQEKLRQQRDAAMLPNQGRITAPLLAATVGRILADDAILLDETVSNSGVTLPLTARRRPASYFGSGGSSLGWGVGAALGAKLAACERDVVLAVGDGAFVFGAPTAAFWAARGANKLPFLTVIYNNVGWNAVKGAALDQHPEGYAQQANDFTASFDPPSDLGMVAAGGSLHGAGVRPRRLGGGAPSRPGGDVTRASRRHRRPDRADLSLSVLDCYVLAVANTEQITLWISSASGNEKRGRRCAPLSRAPTPRG